MILMDASKMLKTPSTEWVPQIAILRIAACLAIVVLHTVFAANEYFIDEITMSQNTGSRIIENNMMWAVPVFLMVTGTLHLNRRKPLTIRKLYKKYIFRVAGALVLFSLVFRLFDMTMDREALSVTGLLKGFYELITSSGWGHLWYLYLLIGLYILMPFYKKIAEVCSDSELVYLASVYTVFISIIPVIESFGINIGFYISESLIYPLYLFLGHMIHEKRLRVSRKEGLALTVISTVLITLLTVVKYRYNAEIPSVLYGYQSPLIIAQSTGIFMLIDCSNFDIQSEPGRRFISGLDGMTFGIYLIHMLFIRLIFRYMQFNPYNYFAPVMLVICITGFFAVSALLVCLLKKIPGLKSIL